MEPPLTLAASLEVGYVVSLNAPLLLSESSSNVVFKIENAAGVGIDLNQLNLGNGVVLPISVSLKVVGIDLEDEKMVYRLKVIEKYH